MTRELERERECDQSGVCSVSSESASYRSTGPTLPATRHTWLNGMTLFIPQGGCQRSFHWPLEAGVLTSGKKSDFSGFSILATEDM